MLKQAWSSKRLKPIAASLSRDCGCGAAEHRCASHPCNNFLIPWIALKRDIHGGQRMKSVDWKNKELKLPKPKLLLRLHLFKWHNTVLILMCFPLHLSVLPAATAWQMTEAWGELPQAARISSSLWEHFDTEVTHLKFPYLVLCCGYSFRGICSEGSLNSSSLWEDF